MAYDPEAREKSKNAMVIGIVTLVLVVFGAIAFLATRPREDVTVINPGTRIIEKTTVMPPAPPVPGAPAPPIVIERPVVVGGGTKTVERTTTNNTRVIQSPPPGAAAQPPQNNVNVTVESPPPAESPATPETGMKKPADNSGGVPAEGAANAASNAPAKAATPTAGY